VWSTKYSNCSVTVCYSTGIAVFVYTLSIVYIVHVQTEVQNASTVFGPEVRHSIVAEFATKCVTFSDKERRTVTHPQNKYGDSLLSLNNAIFVVRQILFILKTGFCVKFIINKI